MEDYAFTIVVDGMLTSEQNEILERSSRNDSRIALLQNGEQMGIAYSLNRAIIYSKSKYIARMDADDVSLPERLERQVAFLERNREIDLVGTCAYEVDEEQRIVFKKYMPVNSSELPSFLAKRNPFIHPTVVFRRRFFERVGLYSSAFFRNEDTDLWCRAFAAGIAGANLGEFLYLFRVDKNFLDRRRGKVHAIEEASLRWNYIRNSGLPFYNFVYPLLTFSMRMTPEWTLRLLYRFAR
jgi:glycosyltransferase involved in cell wall biosynthesis